MRAVALFGVGSALVFLFAAEGLSMENITPEQAYNIAIEKIQNIDKYNIFVIYDDCTSEHNFGWEYTIVTKKYLESKDANDEVPGLGPLVVDRDGSVKLLTSSVDPSTAIKEHEKEWELRHPQ